MMAINRMTTIWYVQHNNVILPHVPTRDRWPGGISSEDFPW